MVEHNFALNTHVALRTLPVTVAKGVKGFLKLIDILEIYDISDLLDTLNEHNFY